MKLKDKIAIFYAVVIFATGSSFTKPASGVGSKELSANSNDFMTVSNYAMNKTVYQLDSFYRLRHKAGFNGCVLIAKDGKTIYSEAFGYADYKKDTLTTETPIQLASVTKTFTGTAIMLLAENGFLSLDDTIQKFFPDLPYKGITVKHLLTHRSGLPEYIYWEKDFTGTESKYITNDKLVSLLTEKKPPVRNSPNRIFQYCNTNYALLASVIEKATGLSYAKFMNDIIFSPLGMNNTFVFNGEDPTNYCGAKCFDTKWRQWKEFLSDGVVGDKGIYSSAEDMLKWDVALRNGYLLSESSLKEAYMPRSLDKYSFQGDKDKNYGYGWRMMKKPDNSYLIYHNGNWHGCNNVFARDLNDGFTVIVLGNKENENNYWVQPVWEMLFSLKMAEDVADMQ